MPVLAEFSIGSAPKHNTCLSISLTNTCKDLVGGKLAPDKSDKATALVCVPELASQ